MSFQRTRMSADRTLMSIIRTALSLISFGFTIFQVFQKMQESKMLDASGREPRNFGIALVVLGMVMLTLGIVYHVNYMRELRAERVRMMDAGPGPRREQVPGVADADYRRPVVAAGPAGRGQHGVQRSIAGLSAIAGPAVPRSSHSLTCK